MVFILRLWERRHGEPVWIGEVQDVQAGETVRVQGLDALYDLLRQKMDQAREPKLKTETTTNIVQTERRKT